MEPLVTILLLQLRQPCTTCKSLSFQTTKRSRHDSSKTGTWCPTEGFITIGHRDEGKGEHYVSLTTANSQTLSHLLPSTSNMANVSHIADSWDTRTSTAAAAQPVPQPALLFATINKQHGQCVTHC